jgi:hypothetical protein
MKTKKSEIKDSAKTFVEKSLEELAKAEERLREYEEMLAKNLADAKANSGKAISVEDKTGAESMAAAVAGRPAARQNRGREVEAAINHPPQDDFRCPDDQHD